MKKTSLSLLKLIGIAIVAAITATSISNAQSPLRVKSDTIRIGNSNTTTIFNNDVLRVRNDGLVHIVKGVSTNRVSPITQLGFGQISNFNTNPMYQIGHVSFLFAMSPNNMGSGFYFGGYNSNNTFFNNVEAYMFLTRAGLSIGCGFSEVGILSTGSSLKLDVNGKARFESTVYSSDKRLKKDIKPLVEDFDKLSKLNSIKYKRSSEVLRSKLEDLKNNKEKYSEAKEHYEMMFASLETQIQEADADTTTRFGFIAQELRELYPELVVEDNEGYLAVNYTGMIPVLVEAIKELKAEINELKGKDFEKTTNTQVISTAKLYQNNPNPFSENTEIKYYIPENASSAMICIYDLIGSQIMRFDLRDRGYSSLTVRGRELKAGMYIYALLVDGKEIDNKRMILTGE